MLKNFAFHPQSVQIWFCLPDPHTDRALLLCNAKNTGFTEIFNLNYCTVSELNFLRQRSTSDHRSHFTTVIFVYWNNRSAIMWRWKRLGTHSNMWSQKPVPKCVTEQMRSVSRESWSTKSNLFNLRGTETETIDKKHDFKHNILRWSTGPFL